MFDPVLGQFLFEAGGAPPVGILPAVVGKHLFRNTIFTHGTAVGLDHVLGRLAAVKPQSGDITAVIVDIPDQVGILAGQAKSQDIALPHLVGGGPFKKAGLGGIFLRLLFCRGGHPLITQGSSDCRRTGLEQEKPLEDIADAFDPEPRVLFLQIDDLLGNGGRHLRWR